MYKCSEKDPVLSANNGNTKEMVLNRWSTMKTLSVEQFSADFDIRHDILGLIIRLGG